MPKHSLTKEEIEQYFHLPLEDAANKLGVCAAALKRSCKQHGIEKWPYKKLFGLLSNKTTEKNSLQDESTSTEPQKQISSPKASPIPCLSPARSPISSHSPLTIPIISYSVQPVKISTSPTFQPALAAPQGNSSRLQLDEEVIEFSVESHKTVLHASSAASPSRFSYDYEVQEQVGPQSFRELVGDVLPTVQEISTTIEARAQASPSETRFEEVDEEGTAHPLPEAERTISPMYRNIARYLDDMVTGHLVITNQAGGVVWFNPQLKINVPEVFNEQNIGYAPHTDRLLHGTVSETFYAIFNNLFNTVELEMTVKASSLHYSFKIKGTRTGSNETRSTVERYIAEKRTNPHTNNQYSYVWSLTLTTRPCTYKDRNPISECLIKQYSL